jgi:hypothetical protein
MGMARFQQKKRGGMAQVRGELAGTNEQTTTNPSVRGVALLGGEGRQGGGAAQAIHRWIEPSRASQLQPTTNPIEPPTHQTQAYQRVTSTTISPSLFS